MNKILIRMVIEAGLYRAGKIPMIKFVRILTDCDLKTTKELVESYNLDFPTFSLEEQKQLTDARIRSF